MAEDLRSIEQVLFCIAIGWGTLVVLVVALMAWGFHQALKDQAPHG